MAIAADQRLGAGVVPPAEEIEARAARLGITADRVLEEYRRIAFASLGDVASWDDNGLTIKPSNALSADVVAAIAEIVASASSGRIYRIRMHDKKPMLDAIGRYLLQPPKTTPQETDLDDASRINALIAEIDRLTAEDAARSSDPGTAEPAGTA